MSACRPTYSSAWAATSGTAAQTSTARSRRCASTQPLACCASHPTTRRTPSAGQRGLVTGSTGGIGRAIAEALAGAGAWVIVHGRNSERGKTVANELHAHDVAALAMCGDLRAAGVCTALADAAWGAWDGLDIL